jgi:hypothetical protein
VPAAASAAVGTECAVNTTRAWSRTAAGRVARAALTASAFAATNAGWSKKCRSFTSSGAVRDPESPTAFRARAMSSWYCRHAE